MRFTWLSRYQPQLLAVLRIVTALLFIEHGTMKLFHFPAAQMEGPLPPLIMVAAIIELVAGIMVALGLFTRLAAFIAAGEMAVAYFMGHASQGVFPANNGGDAAILFCFIYFYLIFAGPGAWSLDGMRGRSSVWYRIRLNLRNVPEDARPPQEALEVDYDPWAGAGPPGPGSEPA